MTSLDDNVKTGSRGILKPPRLGETFKDRFEIWELFGGQRQKGIWKFPGDSKPRLVIDDADFFLVNPAWLRKQID